MKIKTIKVQHRRDFFADFECENCGNVVEMWGYDDDNYHRNVIPKMVCKKCGKTAPDNYRPLATKYKPYEII